VPDGQTHEAALGLLKARFSKVTQRHAGLASGLQGEAGIGKTHTAQALLRALPCRSLTVHAAAPLSALLLGMPPLRASQVRAAPAGGAESDPALLAGRLALAAPFVLHVEDLHEAGPERTEFWSRLALAVTRTRGVGLLVTSRQQLPAGFEVVRLRPLDRPALETLLEGTAGASLPPEALDWLTRQAAGNPLFTLEYFQLLARQGSLWNDGQRWRWREPRRETLPVTVEAVIEQALGEVLATGPLRDQLGARALLAADAGTGLVAAVAAQTPEEYRRAATELERRGVLFRGQFVHPLYRELGLKLLAPADRQRLARRALDLLHGRPGEAAGFVEAAELPRDEALGWLRRAADAARAAGHDLQAAQYLARATGYASGPERGALALEAARPFELVNENEALRLAQIAVQERPHDPQALQLLAARHALAGRGAEVEALLARLPDEARVQRDWLERLLGLRFGLNEYRAVTSLWNDHPALQQHPDPLTAYRVAFSALFSPAIAQPFEFAERLAAETLARPGLDLDTRSRLHGVWGLSQLYRDVPEALAASKEHLDESVALARQSGKPAWLASTLHNRAILSERLSLRDDLLADLREAVTLYREAGSSRHFASTQTKLARHLNEAGDYKAAEELLLESRDVLRRGDASVFLATCEAQLSRLYFNWQPPHGGMLALRHAREALRLGRLVGQESKIALGLNMLSCAESRFGDPAEGLRLAEELARRVGLDPDRPVGATAGAPGAAPIAAEVRCEVLMTLARAQEATGRQGEATATFGLALLAAQEGALSNDAQLAGLELDRLNGDLESARRRLAWAGQQNLGHLAGLILRAFPALKTEAAPVRSAPGQGPSTTVQGPPSQARPPAARLELLGDLRVVQGGEPRPVRGRKRQALLGLLAQARLAGHTELARTDLLDTLYPGTPELQASAALRDLVHQLRSDLGAGALSTTDSGYALGDLSLDAAEFLSGGDTRLWRGPYLAGLDAESGDETVREALSLALAGRAAALLHADPVEAVRLGRLLIEANPYSRAALHLTLRALRASGNHRGMGREYARAVARLSEVGETLPGQWADFLASELPESDFPATHARS